MAKYLNLSKDISWQELLPKMGPNICSLLLRDDMNYTLAWGCKKKYSQETFDKNSFKNFINGSSKSYIFGFFSYELKNYFEPKLSSRNQTEINLPEIFLFIPEHIIFKSNNSLTYFGDYNENEISEFLNKNGQLEKQNDQIKLKQSITKNQYLNNFKKIKEQLSQGNIYEINYCQTFSAKFNHFDPYKSFTRLVNLTSAPFSSYLSLGNKQVLCASPERFLKKMDRTLISQPIKGTAKRSSIISEDTVILNELKNNSKELSENYMIVDLVRNDLSKIAVKNSVKVSELAQPYSFKTVHQLISTIVAEQKKDVDFIEILTSTFPMGSMTGAPKFKAMEIADELEDFKRGLYSGAIGYIAPNGNFDFNVVIRSLIVDSKLKKVSASVGGAITVESDSEKEYQECFIKLKALQETLC